MKRHKQEDTELPAGLQDGPGLLEALAQAEPWAVALVRALDPDDRCALLGTSQGCSQCLLETSAQASVSLRAHGGHSEAAWQKRLAYVAQALTRRGRDSKLVFRPATPNPQALQSLLGLPEAAGRAVTELEVQARDIPTPWLQAFPTTFPNLRALSLDLLCGRLPPASSLPHLRELSVGLPRVRYSARPDAETYRSIGAYTPQLTTLDITGTAYAQKQLLWSTVFKKKTTTLTHLGTDDDSSDALLREVRRRIPNLHRLTCQARQPLPDDGSDYDYDYDYGDECGTSHMGGEGDHSHRTWSVKELVLWGPTTDANLAQLPQSELALTIRGKGPEGVCIHFCVVDREGLSDAVVRRMYQWHFDPSCTILLDWRSYDDTPDLSIEDLGSGIEAALRQLSPMLMPGSVVTLHRSYNPVGWEDWISTVCAAVAAAAPTMPHVTVLAPCVEGSEKAITVLGQQDPPVQHACINGIHRLHGVSHTPWPWQSLTVTPVVLSELLELPDPRGGVYDIRLSVLCAYYSELTPEVSQELMERLPHWRFVMGENQCTLYIRAREDLSPAKQPAALRSILASLSGINWHATSESQVLEVSLDDWTLTSALIQELRRLPQPVVPVRLMFRNCACLPDVDYSQLPGLVPTCYAEWRLWYVASLPVRGRYTAQHIVDVCRGAEARERGAKKLTVMSGAHYFSENEKSWVEQEMDEQGLWRWVKDIQWDF